MKNGGSPVAKGRVHVVAVHCPRLHCQRTPAEHLQCPYCFGRLADISTGDRRCFCDYRPLQDPLCFGFPADYGRHLQE